MAMSPAIADEKRMLRGIMEVVSVWDVVIRKSDGAGSSMGKAMLRQQRAC